MKNFQDKCVSILVDSQDHIFSLKVHPFSNLIVRYYVYLMSSSGSYHDSIKIWDIRKKDCLDSWEAHCDPVTSVDITNDGTMILSSSYDGIMYT